jgi:drug/metabolite transporter (DMT)-like permease
VRPSFFAQIGRVVQLPRSKFPNTAVMSPSDSIKLVFLAAIWGGSFIFLRIAVPEVGPLLTALLRVSLAGAALLGFATMTGVCMNWRRNAKSYALVGLFATALPFSCFSFASLYLPAAYSALLNSTAPLFGALFSVLWLAERLTPRKLSGLALGVTGVGVLVGAGALVLDAKVLLAAAACLLAAACYAVSSIIVKKTGRPSSASGGINPIAMATGSMLWGALIMAPTLPFSWPAAMPSATALWCVLAMSLLSSAVAQAIFIPLIVKIGPTRAMSVSFLIPLFSMLWAFIFLHEAVGLSTLFGGAIVLVAMGLVLTARHPEPEDALTVEA